MTMVAYVDMRRGNGKVNRCISYAIQGCCVEENTIEAATRWELSVVGGRRRNIHRMVEHEIAYACC